MTSSLTIMISSSSFYCVVVAVVVVHIMCHVMISV